MQSWYVYLQQCYVYVSKKLSSNISTHAKYAVRILPTDCYYSPIVSFLFITGQLYGLEKFWAYLKYSRRREIQVEPKIREVLNRYKTLEDFRVLVRKIYI